MGATILALTAILVWSSLAILNTRVNHLPPLLAVGVALCVGGFAGLPRVREWKVPLRTFLVGVGGIFGYHALLFAAFRMAPAVEVNLVNYLWPLLIVVLSPAFLPGFALRPRHLLGALLGFAGAGLVVAGGGRLGFAASSLPGYLLAAAAAFAWAAYSLLTKRLPPFPTGAVGGFCLASGLLALGAYGLGLALRGEPAPALAAADWAWLAALGAGPMGGAFYAWDAALKRGDPRSIGALSYLTPLLSTFLLVALGGKAMSPNALVAMALIVSGAVAGSIGGRAGPGGRRGRRTGAEA